MIDITANNAYIVTMAVLNIRNLPDDVHARLRVRAAEAGRSMEAEAREILTTVCRADEAKRPASILQDLVDELYGADKPEGIVQSLLDERRREAQNQ
jgi:plasmid stability protein